MCAVEKSFSDSYKAAGVDVTAGYRAVELMKAHVARTMNSSVVSGIGGFGGLFELDLTGIQRPVQVSGTDGVGTKLKLAFLLDKHDTVGIDCVAMCANDVALSLIHISCIQATWSITAKAPNNGQMPWLRWTGFACRSSSQPLSLIHISETTQPSWISMTRRLNDFTRSCSWVTTRTVVPRRLISVRSSMICLLYTSRCV